jgi:hypothetical protein
MQWATLSDLIILGLKETVITMSVSLLQMRKLIQTRMMCAE